MQPAEGVVLRPAFRVQTLWYRLLPQIKRLWALKGTVDAPSKEYINGETPLFLQNIPLYRIITLLPKGTILVPPAGLSPPLPLQK
jgi:hypothetical protein